MSRLEKKLIKIKKHLDKKALRDPKTRPQMHDKINWNRIKTILYKRYDLT